MCEVGQILVLVLAGILAERAVAAAATALLEALVTVVAVAVVVPAVAVVLEVGAEDQ